MRMKYDDEQVLARCVFDNCGSFLTEFEKRVAMAIHWQAKAATSNPAMARLIEIRHRLVGDAEVDAALADGVDAFRRRCCQRVLTDNAGKIFINRCPRCNRIVRTPKALQCFWCGNDWHGTPAEAKP